MAKTLRRSGGAKDDAVPNLQLEILPWSSTRDDVSQATGED